MTIEVRDDEKAIVNINIFSIVKFIEVFTSGYVP